MMLSLLAIVVFARLGTSSTLLQSRDASFNWSTISSSSSLQPSPCYDGFQCAKLTMPLQYSDPSAGEANIALLISPSNFSTGDPNYLGPILFNPGGPGGSGVQYLLEFATYFREIIGPQYDLVGFDPRGIGFTTPPIAFFDSPAEALEVYASYPFSLNESISSLGLAYAKSQIISDLAEQRNKVVMESVSTPAVATDMVNIARAFGFESVNYWGVSYGSVLGATFAAMFPDRIGRFIIDGVVNSHDWYAGIPNSWLLRTEGALTSYYDACVAAGPTLCALYANSSSAIRARVTSVLDSLHVVPVPASNNASALGIVDYGLVYYHLFQILYFPFAMGESFAESIVALESGNALPIYDASLEAGIESFDTCDFDASQPFVPGFIDVIAPIACGDSQGLARRTIQEAQEEYGELFSQTGFWSVVYGLIGAPCAAWNITAKDRLNGTFVTNTSEPILVIGNTLDPITPIDSARNMSAGFVGSVLLEQNSTGHTSLSGFSTCTALAIRSYFMNGTLPAPGTICQTDTQIFQNPANSSAEGGVTFPKGSIFNPREVLEAEYDGVSQESPFEWAVRSLRESTSVHRGGLMRTLRRGV